MTSQQHLYWKIYRCITIKLNLSRQLQHLCQDDQSFLEFCEKVTGFRYLFEDIKTYAAEFDDCAHENLLEAVLHLFQLKDRTLKELLTFQLLVQSSGNSDEFHQLAEYRIYRAIEILEKQFATWLQFIENQLFGLNDIYGIYNLKTRVEQLHWFHRNDLRNLINQKEKLTPPIAQAYLVNNLKKLQASVQHHSDRTLKLVRMFTNSDQTTPDAVSKALEQLQETDEIPEPTPEDVQRLREILFSTGTTPLKDQKLVAETEKTVRKRQLGSQLAQISEIEEKMEQLFMAIEELNRETAKQLEKLELMRQQLREGMFELLRLQQLIRAIDEEISLRIQSFQASEDAVDAQRLEIESDPALSEVEKREQLASLQAEEDQLRQRHTSVLLDLQNRKSELVKTAKVEAEKMLAVKEQLAEKHLDEIAHIERQKLAASPSETLLLQAKIEKLNSDFQQHMELMQHFKQERVYEFDEFGRYYVDSEGHKIYKRHSGASEYMLNESGDWVKVQEADVELLRDEKGEYYLDQFNRKVYVKRIFDASGGRTGPTDEMYQYSDDSDDEQELSAETTNDYRYIRSTIGRPLTQGLARLVLLQPHDPVNYLANYLLQYQYNKDRLAAREAELQDLLAMRKQLPAEERACGLGAKTSFLK